MKTHGKKPEFFTPISTQVLNDVEEFRKTLTEEVWTVDSVKWSILYFMTEMRVGRRKGPKEGRSENTSYLNYNTEPSDFGGKTFNHYTKLIDITTFGNSMSHLKIISHS